MLRTGILALTTLNTSRSFLSTRSPLIFVTRLVQVAIHLINVHHGKDLGDVNAHRTAWGAIVTSGTGNVGKLLQCLTCFFQHAVLLNVQRLEISCIIGC